MIKKLFTKWYQFQADMIITAIETMPSRYVPMFYGLGMSLNDTAIEKDIWLN